MVKLLRDMEEHQKSYISFGNSPIELPKKIGKKSKIIGSKEKRDNILKRFKLTKY